MGASQKKLGNLCEFISGGTPATKVKKYYQGDIPWITGADISDYKITQPREYITLEAIEKSATNIVPENNILLVTRTGVGKVAINPFDICISQDFTGIVPDKTKVDLHYIFYLLRAKQDYFISNQRGATIQGITRDVVTNLDVPLPRLPEQKRIGAILDRADRLRRLCRYALELGDSYLQSVFLEMFGDPVTNLMRWEVEQVNDLCDLVRGSSPRPRSDPRYYGGPIPRLMVEDLTRDGLFVTPRIDSLTEEGAKKSRPMEAGSVVMVVSGDTGLPGILNVDACIHDGFVGFRKLSAILSPIFFAYQLVALKLRSEKQATGAIWQNLTTDQIKRWEIICPPLHLQNKFTQIVNEYERLRVRQREGLRQAEHLFQSLLNKAF